MLGPIALVALSVTQMNASAVVCTFLASLRLCTSIFDLNFKHEQSRITSPFFTTHVVAYT